MYYVVHNTLNIVLCYMSLILYFKTLCLKYMFMNVYCKLIFFTNLLDKTLKNLYHSHAEIDGELAVPCNLQSAIAGLNACLGVIWLKMCAS